MNMLRKGSETNGACRVLHFMLLLSLVVGISGCKSSRKLTSSSLETSRYLSSKVQLTIPHKGSTFTLNGTMKLIRGERMQLSLLMPIIRTEVARLEVTPEDILVIDRMGKRYVQATRQELKGVLPRRADFAHLEKLLFEASKPNGKSSLTGKELGLPHMETAQIVLSGFSEKEFSLSRTQISSKYTQVAWTEIFELLMRL